MNVNLTQPFEIAVRALGDDDRRTVSAWLEHLKNWDTDDYVRNQSKKLDTGDNVYVLKISPELRIFFRVEQRRIFVLDVATRAAIMAFGHVAEQRRR